MKQVLQDMAKGNSMVTEAPAPSVAEGKLLIATSHSLISSGTERMLVDFGKASYFAKIKQQPEKVKMVLEKIKTDGLLNTIDAVRSKLAQPLPLGYCNVGCIIETGKKVNGFKPGDRVVSNGPHADIVHIGTNLCALIPPNVDNESASFTVLASIGLQGIRLAQPTLGEAFVVTGVGLIGLLTVQLLKAHGCRVLAVDFDDKKLKLAKQFGAEICNPALGEDPIAAGMEFSRGQGIDGVIITASTQSNEPVTQAAQMSRKKGRIVLVGVAGLELNRADFYEKELSFQVSCSYGPGRYESQYEEKGVDYPIGLVRWTEQRNFEAVLDMMASGQIDVTPLISHRFAFENALEAYQILTEDKSALGLLLEYNAPVSQRLVKQIELLPHTSLNPAQCVLGAIGAGNYASRVLLPAFKAAGAQLHTLVTAGGINSVIQGKKNGFACASTDVAEMMANQEINTVVIVTRHNSHTRLVLDSLAVEKNIFVEKPLAISLGELAEIEKAYHTAKLAKKKTFLMVGFNRRFAPHIQKIKFLLNSVKASKVCIITVNAGAIPQDHWTQDEGIGGGRIIGEACHFIDLMRFLIGFEINSIQAKKMNEAPQANRTEDKVVISLGFCDGSMGTIHYLANGASSFPKERIEIFTAGRVLQLDNFRKLKGFGWPGFKKMNLWRQNKGQLACAKEFLTAIEQGKNAPIPIDEIFEVTRISIEAAQLVRQQRD